ncbi:hypothetical protein [Rhizobium sp. SG2393]|uniref:hypothetical protein n=1 Tax=Rhizobium sp. SG2393 TaxID=3276279 RepID=UPI00366F16B1
MTGAAEAEAGHAGMPARLAAAFGEAEVTLWLPGLAGLANAISLGPKLRGSLGEVLLQSASPAVRARQPCPWPRHSTADLFFGPGTQVTLAGETQSIARPFVLFGRAERSGALSITLRVFGSACERAEAVFDALISAIGKVDWSSLSRDIALGLPSPVTIEKVSARRNDAPFDLRRTSSAADMIFVSPIDADRGDPTRDPGLLLARLCRRLALLSPWFGLAPDACYAACLHEAEAANITLVEISSVETAPVGGHHFANRLAPPMHLRLTGLSPAMRLALMIGERVHIGRGASIGLGRYRLHWRDAATETEAAV